MKTATLAQVSKRCSRPTGESPASATLKTDWAELFERPSFPFEQLGAGKNGTSPREPAGPLPINRTSSPLLLDTNLK